ncbi:hypothetical protein OKW29_000070 [Paraburkholderia sp. CI3]
MQRYRLRNIHYKQTSVTHDFLSNPRPLAIFSGSRMVRRETISGNCSEAPTDGAFTQVNIVRLCFTETASNNFDAKVSNIQLRLRLEGGR